MGASLRSDRRDFHLIQGRDLLVVDALELAQDGRLPWWMPLMARPQLGRSSVRHGGERGGISSVLLLCASGAPSLSTAQGLENAAPAEFAGLATHHRVTATTPGARTRTLVTLSTPYRKGRSAWLQHCIGNQGQGVNQSLQDAPGDSDLVPLPRRV
jgi:hypothetical protein